MDPVIELLGKMLDKAGNACSKMCVKMNWSRDWKELGIILHLETSEFIEAIRGKGKDSPEAEVADILFALLSGCHHHGISMVKVMEALELHIKECEEKAKDVSNQKAVQTPS